MLKLLSLRLLDGHCKTKSKRRLSALKLKWNLSVRWLKLEAWNKDKTSSMASSNKVDLDDMTTKLSDDASASIANTFSSIDVAKNHDRTTQLELELGQRETGAVDRVEILNRIHQLSLARVWVVVEQRIGTVGCGLFSWKAVENVLVDFVDITVAAGENGTTGEVLTVRKWMLINAGIDVVDESGKGIFGQLKVEGKLDCSICSSVTTMTDIQLPLSKGTFFIQTDIEAHVLCEMQNLDRRPQSGALHAGIDYIWAGSLDDDRKDLLKLATKDNRKAAKGSIGVANIPEGAVDSLMKVTMLHGCLIPNDQISIANEISDIRGLGDSTGGRLMDEEGNFKG